MSKPIERMWKAKHETARWCSLFEAAKLVSYGKGDPAAWDRALSALTMAVRDLEQEDDSGEDES